MPKRILFVIGRDDWIKSEYMDRMSLGGLRDLGLKIMWEDPRFGWNLKTPMLIIQGNQDEYGGSEVGRDLPLSPGIELFFIDSTHDYRLDGRQWGAVQSKIESALRLQA